LPLESVLIPALVLLAIGVGIWPAISAYRTDVARSLGK
jgi:putative ABC transport system permease protein